MNAPLADDRLAVDEDESQIAQLHRALPLVAVIGTASAFILGLLYQGWHLTAAVGWWLAAFVLVSVARASASMYYVRAQPRRGSRRAWWTWTASSSLAHAFLWGAAGLVLMTPSDAVAEALLHVGLASVAMNAAVHLVGFYRLLVAYTLTVLVPLVLRDAWLGGTFQWSLAAMAVVICIANLLNSKKQSAAIAESIAQRRKNAELIEALRLENQRSEAARRMAEEANAAKSRFFAAANHDLRQPLHAMGLLAQTLHAHAPQVNVDKVSGHLVECVDGMTHVVDELLEITRLDLGNITSQQTAFAIDGLLRETVHTYQALARAKGLQLELRADSGVIVRSDRALLARVLANLVSNAIRYTLHGSVRLAASANERHVAVSVEDSGIGIAPEHQQRIFEEFYQVANPARDRRLGLGLGLATVKRLSDLLALDIAVNSTLGASSTFHLTVPRAAANEPIVEPPRAALPVPLPSAQRVLVIEDDADSRKALLGLLRQWGCTARGATDAAQALPWLAQGFRPDALLVDLRLADGASGLDAIAELRAATGCELPALILTGDVDGERAREARARGFSVLIKPAKPLQVRAFLSQAFSNP
jgi:two-component system, sensor histidine kinase